MSGDVVSVERMIHAPPEAIFALVADSSRHPDIDGSGSVIELKPDAPHKLTQGSVFGMGMKLGIRYSMVNTVVEYEENRRIAWKAEPPPGLMARLSGGRIWRYELEPTDSGTRVRESWDISQDKQRAMLRIVAAGQVKRSMEKTLERIEQLTASARQPPT
ncbi:MAG TPA: SRPBCC family protein [Acidimicrobiales bacterium]|nr:SRPBCC family protein [Acidimicrobiales bacterium]